MGPGVREAEWFPALGSKEGIYLNFGMALQENNYLYIGIVRLDLSIDMKLGDD